MSDVKVLEEMGGGAGGGGSAAVGGAAEAPSNVSANLGGPNSDNKTNISGYDLPFKRKKVIKRVGPKLIAKAKMNKLTEEEKVDLGSDVILICEEYKLSYEI